MEHNIKIEFMNITRYYCILLSLSCLAVICGGSCLADESQKGTKAEEYYYDAAAEYVNGRYDRAANVLRKAIQLDTTFANAYNLLGMSYLKLRQWPSAEQTLRQAIHCDSNYAYAYFNLSEAIYSNPVKSDEEIAEAVRFLKESLQHESNPDQILKIRIRLGDYLYSLGDVEGAWYEYYRAILIDSLCLPARLGLANTLDDSAAAEEILKILDIDSTYTPALRYQANLAIIDNNFLQAIILYNRALDYDSSRCLTYHSLIQLIDYYSDIVAYWKDWYFVEGKKKGSTLFVPWFGYKKYETMLKDQGIKFARNGKDYKKLVAVCRDSLFVPLGIKRMIINYRQKIFLRQDSTSCFKMSEFLDALGNVLTEFRMNTELKARRNTSCPLPIKKDELPQFKAALIHNQ